MESTRLVYLYIYCKRHKWMYYKGNVFLGLPVCYLKGVCLLGDGLYDVILKFFILTLTISIFISVNL